MSLRLWVLSASLSIALLVSSALALTPDGEALLELKAAFNDTKRMLRSWRRADLNPCGWNGITCHFPDLRVRSMSVILALSFCEAIVGFLRPNSSYMIIWPWAA
ncbi:putative LRR receptor-like serine/threonine-protein kinase FEI 1 [Cocos nucifera]|nr:putative LRR receptor-like serine/threonine-protein kinase FEI 1 [Cocos nucifera]